MADTICRGWHIGRRWLLSQETRRLVRTQFRVVPAEWQGQGLRLYGLERGGKAARRALKEVEGARKQNEEKTRGSRGIAEERETGVAERSGL